jgi:hypothetical protein
MGRQRFAPGVIHFDRITCCAFENWHGRRRGPARSYDPWPTLRIALGQFIDTLRISFIPTPSQRTLYVKTAMMEIDYLQKTSFPLIYCQHQREEHVTALVGIIDVLAGSKKVH